MNMYISMYIYNTIQSALASERNSVVVGSTAVMAGNDFLAKKSITQNRKTLITQPKHLIFL